MLSPNGENPDLPCCLKTKTLRAWLPKEDNKLAGVGTKSPLTDSFLYFSVFDSKKKNYTTTIIITNVGEDFVPTPASLLSSSGSQARKVLVFKQRERLEFSPFGLDTLVPYQ